MAELRATLERLLNREDLAEPEAAELLVALTDPSMAPAMAGALLAALRGKGLTADEVRGFASAMRRLARRPSLQYFNWRRAADCGAGRAGRQARQSLDLESVRQCRPA
jgi:anthranilate phosphoribosyltransferase